MDGRFRDEWTYRKSSGVITLDIQIRLKEKNRSAILTIATRRGDYPLLRAHCTIVYAALAYHRRPGCRQNCRRRRDRKFHVYDGPAHRRFSHLCIIPKPTQTHTVLLEPARALILEASPVRNGSTGDGLLEV